MTEPRVFVQCSARGLAWLGAVERFLSAIGSAVLRQTCVVCVSVGFSWTVLACFYVACFVGVTTDRRRIRPRTLTLFFRFHRSFASRARRCERRGNAALDIRAPHTARNTRLRQTYTRDSTENSTNNFSDFFHVIFEDIFNARTRKNTLHIFNY